MSDQEERFETEEDKKDEVEAHGSGHRHPLKNDEGTDDDSSEDFEAHRAGGHRGPV